MIDVTRSVEIRILSDRDSKIHELYFRAYFGHSRLINVLVINYHILPQNVPSSFLDLGMWTVAVHLVFFRENLKSKQFCGGSLC